MTVAGVREIRDSHVARTWLLQSLCLQRLAPLTEKSLAEALNWTMELASADEPLLPPGVVADIARLIFGTAAPARDDVESDRSLSPDLARAYEDYVLGKLYADASFERGGAAVCRYEGRDRHRALAWLVARFRERAGIEGVVLSPGVVRSLQALPSEQLLSETSQAFAPSGLLPEIPDEYRQLIASVRLLGEALGEEDVFELEHGTALVEFGQRLALRQTLHAAGQFAKDLPLRPPRKVESQRTASTHLLDEDTYPVGGFTSISTKGSIESLLHSQLAFMESDPAQQPDMFAIKYMRSELLYYSRDENEFLRRRRTIHFVLFPDLVNCRIRDEHLPWQRIIVILAALIAVTNRLIEWLSHDALTVAFLFVGDDGPDPLSDEQALLNMILQDQIANGTVRIERCSLAEIHEQTSEAARRSLTNCVLVSVGSQDLTNSPAETFHLKTSRAEPELRTANRRIPPEPDAPWKSILQQLCCELA
ncbi:MAG: hypothetical protein R3C49_28165 [Planctomycetaceae bacterium]